MSFPQSKLATKLWKHLWTLGRGLFLCAPALLLVFSVGCTKTSDVTNDPNFGKFKSVVGVWKTKFPLHLVEIEKKLYLSTDLEIYSGQNKLLIVPEGTEIRIERLVFKDTFETTYLDVMGSVLIGGHTNKVNVDDRLFLKVRDGKYTVTQYYSTWNGHDYPKPEWIPAPDKIERVLPESAPK